MKQEGYTFVAHNAKAYDNHFIYNYCLENCLDPKVILAGTKIMQLSVEKAKVRFIDSYNFIAQPLKQFPKTFDLKDLKQGYFPHKFNLPENWNYVGKLPTKNIMIMIE